MGVNIFILNMLPEKPVKKFGLGLRISSKLNRSFNWLEWANQNTFDTHEELNEFMKKNPDWNRHRNQNNSSIKNKYCGPIELTEEELNYWNSVGK